MASVIWPSLLADLVALIHGAVVLYIGLGLLLLGVGLWRGWRWVRGFWFRVTHLGLCLAVVAFEWRNEPCPLTTLERYLRARTPDGAGYEGSFIAHYVSAAIHVDLPPSALAAPTSILLLLLLALYFWAGPRRKPKDPRTKPKAANQGGKETR